MAKPIPTAKQLREDCSASYQQALTWARKNCEPGFLLSRGKWIRVRGDDDSIVDSEMIEFKGTQKQIDEIVAEYVGKPGVTQIFIEGGINWCENLNYYGDGDYEPWVAEWYVGIWSMED